MNFLDSSLLPDTFNLLFQPMTAALILGGVLWGAFCGLLPGIGTAFGIGVMLPTTLAMEPPTAVAFLVSISVGASFGNSPTAIMIGVPGNASALLSALDGFGLTKLGRPGLAMAAAWLGACFGQLVSIVPFVLGVIVVSTLGYSFLAPEMFTLYLCGLAALAALMGKSVAKGIAAAAFGVLLSTLGPDPVNAVPRLTFGVPELRDGLPVIPVVIGLVTVAELAKLLRSKDEWVPFSSSDAKFPPLRELRRLGAPTLIGGVGGTVFGMIPGLGGTAAAMLSYQGARLASRRKEEFGHSSAEGLIANEAAQNAAQAGEMVPTLGLGIPGSDSMVLVLAALTLHGFVPGPMLMVCSPELLGATVASLLGGALIILAIGWWLGKRMLVVLRVPREVVLPLAFFAAILGVYSLRRDSFDVLVLLVAGAVGYAMSRHGFPTAVAGVAFLLGKGAEQNLRQGLLLVDSDPVSFVLRPGVLGILAATLVVVVLGLGLRWLSRRTPVSRRNLSSDPQAAGELR